MRQNAASSDLSTLTTILGRLVPLLVALNVLGLLVEGARSEMGRLYLLFATVSVVIGVVGIVVGLMWVYRVVRTFPVPDEPINPGWAVVSWFIPIVHLYEPFRLLRRIWVHHRMGPLPVFGIWWAMYAGSTALGYVGAIWGAIIGFRAAGGPLPVPLPAALVALQWVSLALYAVAGLAFLAVLRHILASVEEAEPQAAGPATPSVGA